MFQPEVNTDLNKISLTGLRALIFIGLLINKPCSLKEIKQALIDYKIISEKSSDDILRIDLNTIKLMGCEVDRPSVKNDFKYVLTKHPFDLKITKDDVSILKKVYNSIKNKIGLDKLFDYDELFKNLANYVCDEEIKELLLGISILKYYNIENLKDFVIDCQQKKTLEILYKKTTSKNEEKREIIAQKIEIKNDKLYLYSYDVEKQESRVFNIRRIVSVLSRKIKKGDYEIKMTKIKFIIKNVDIEQLEDNEKIVEELETGFIVEAEYYNDFIAIQRILSFGANCILLEPQELKVKIIDKIKEMRKNYGC